MFIISPCYFLLLLQLMSVLCFNLCKLSLYCLLTVSAVFHLSLFMSTSYLSPRFLWVVCVFRLQQLSLVVLFFCCFARMCSVPRSLSTVDFHVLSLSWAPLVKDFNHVRLTSESRSYLYTCFYSFELIPLSCKFFMTLHVPLLVSFLLCLCLWLCFSVILHVSRQ